MEFLYCIIAFLIATVLYDAFITVLSHKGAGPITTFWTKHCWTVILFFQYKWGLSGPARFAGPFFLIGIFAVWYLLLNTLWVSLFTLSDHSIANPKDANIEFLDIVYFVGTTFSTLGTGDYVPNGFPWTLATSSGALIMSVLTTASVSYILPVVSAVVSRRVLTCSLHLLGKSPQKILKNAWSAPNAGQFDTKAIEIADLLVQESFKAKVYPVLLYFTHDDSHKSLNKGVLNLFDTVCFQLIYPRREHNLSPTALGYVFRSITIYCEHLDKVSENPRDAFKFDHADFFQFLKLSPQQVQGRDFAVDIGEIFAIREKLLVFIYLEGRCAPEKDNVLSFRQRTQSVQVKN